jgi:hypothetical protein
MIVSYLTSATMVSHALRTIGMRGARMSRSGMATMVSHTLRTSAGRRQVFYSDGRVRGVPYPVGGAESLWAIGGGEGEGTGELEAWPLEI